MKWTIHAAATEFGTSRETLTRGLKTLGLNPERGAKFTTKQIHRALAGDLKSERVGLVRAQREAAERSNRVADSNLFEAPEVEAFLIERLVLPLTAAFDAMPQQLAPLLTCDREKDIQTIADYVETRIKPPLRAKLTATCPVNGNGHL